MINFIKKKNKIPRPVVLVIMDGVGVAPPSQGNAVYLANTKNLDKLWPSFPHTYLEASGLAVGLPEGTDGNSEVGHMAIGAGKVIFQSLPRIDNAISNGSFYLNPELLAAFEHAKQNRSAIHILSLVGTGFVHASNKHLEAVIRMAAQKAYNRDKVFLHLFTDGRDSMPNIGIELIEQIEISCIQKKVGHIASIIGRAYAMDRNRNWQRTQKTYDLLVKGVGEVTTNWKDSIDRMYKKRIFDEYIEPIIVKMEDGTIPTIKDNDSIIFVNFRPDRAFQLTACFEKQEFSYFDRRKLNNIYFVGMTEYEENLPTHKAFPSEPVVMPLGKVLSLNGFKQLRISESEKYPHVTYFFNGANKEKMENEFWIEVPSPKVATYDLAPEMSQKEVADIVVEKIKSDEFDFILVNFAAPDMVGHTGSIEATIKAVEMCDQCVGRVVDETLKKDGMVFVIADHGNAEEMIDPKTGEMDTKHSTNPVPFVAIKNDFESMELSMGSITDVAPTILAAMNIPVPPEMTGRNLLV